MTKEEGIRRLREKYGIYNPNIGFYSEILEKYVKDYDIPKSILYAEEEIKIKIMEDWEIGNKDWLVDFINDTCQIKDNRGLNSRYLTFLLQILEKYSIQLDNQSFLYVLHRCPNLNGLLAKYTEENEESHNTNLAWQVFVEQYRNLKVRSYKSAAVIKVPSLTEEAQTCQYMFLCLQNSDEEGFYWYRNQLIEGLQFLVESVAKNYIGQGIDFNTLVNEANVYLLQSILSLATPTQSPLRTKTASFLKRVFDKIIYSIPDPDESLNAIQNSSSDDALEDYVYEQEVKSALEQGINDLKLTEAQTIIFRYGINFTDSPIVFEAMSCEVLAEMDNISHQGVSYREKKALDKLRANKKLKQSIKVSSETFIKGQKRVRRKVEK